MNLLSHEKDKNVEDKTIKDVRNLFGLKKENEAIEDKIIRNISDVFELEN